MDCKSNETSCECDNGKCKWTQGEPVCIEDVIDELHDIGCDDDGNCNGCDMPDWFYQNETNCSNFNKENSECYRYTISINYKNITTCIYNIMFKVKLLLAVSLDSGPVSLSRPESSRQEILLLDDSPTLLQPANLTNIHY